MAGGLVVIALPVIWIAIADATLFAAYVLIAHSPLAVGFSTSWVRVDPLPPALDAAVVLSSGVNSDGTLDQQGLDRLFSGLELVHAGLAPLLVTTASIRTVGERRLTSEADQRRTISLVGVPRWELVDSVSSTRDEATRVAKLLLPIGVKRIAVVTSPMHTRRACATFENVGFVVSCVAAHEHDVSTWHPRTSRDRLAAFRDYLYERLGMVKYRYKGWAR